MRSSAEAEMHFTCRTPTATCLVDGKPPLSPAHLPDHLGQSADYFAKLRGGSALRLVAADFRSLIAMLVAHAAQATECGLNAVRS